MPGALSGEPVNSIPAASKVDLIFVIVDSLLSGKPSWASIRLIVFDATSVLSASSFADHRSALLAARIWSPVNIDISQNVH